MNGEQDPSVSSTTQAAGEEAELTEATPAASATAASSREAEWQAAIDKLTAEKNELTDLLMRKQAELENFRKRMQREREEFLQHATADLIHSLLPTLDAMDRALAHRNEGVPEQYFQGLELIRKGMMDVLGRFGLTSFDSLGQTFDPHLHQAIEMVESGQHRDQEIVEELQRGYRLRKRLLRPAVVKVAVAKPMPGPKPPEPEGGGQPA